MSNQENKPTLLQVIASVFAAAFGVQKTENQERDFTRGKISTFIIAGILFTVGFVLVVYWVVRIVLANAGM